MDVDWLTFTGVVMLAYLIPGPDFALVLRSSTRGWRPGVASACGAQLGLCLHVVLAVLGLSVVLARYPDALTAIRLVGGAYLLYLGGRLVLPTFRRQRPAAVATGALSTRSAFAQALGTNVLNPKAVLFFAAVLPQFIVPGGAPTSLQVAVLGALDVALGFVAWSLVVVLGVRLHSLLERAAVRRWWDRITGAVLAALGGTLMAARG